MPSHLHFTAPNPPSHPPSAIKQSCDMATKYDRLSLCHGVGFQSVFEGNLLLPFTAMKPYKLSSPLPDEPTPRVNLMSLSNIETSAGLASSSRGSSNVAQIEFRLYSFVFLAVMCLYLKRPWSSCLQILCVKQEGILRYQRQRGGVPLGPVCDTFMISQ